MSTSKKEESQNSLSFFKPQPPILPNPPPFPLPYLTAPVALTALSLCSACYRILISDLYRLLDIARFLR